MISADDLKEISELRSRLNKLEAKLNGSGSVADDNTNTETEGSVMGQPSEGGQRQDAVIQAKSFQVIDSQGQVVAEFGFDVKLCCPYISLHGPDHKGYVGIGAQSYGGYALHIMSRDGRTECVLGELQDKAVHVSVLKDNQFVWQSP